MKIQTEDLLAKEITEKCIPRYSAPITLISKSNGNVHLGVDYKKLNEVILDTKPFLRMDEFLHQAKTFEFMKMLDLNAGYHELSVYEPNCDKTAFVCTLF